MVFKNRFIYILIICSNYFSAAQENNNLIGKWSLFALSCDSLGDYRSCYNGYAEYIFSKDSFMIYSLSTDSTIRALKYEIVENNLIKARFNNELFETPFTINDNEFEIVKNGRKIKLYRVEKKRNSLSKNIKEIIKSERQRNAWFRFHSLIVELGYADWNAVLEYSKKYKEINSVLVRVD